MSLHNVKLELKALTSVCLGYQMKGSRDTGYSPKPASLLHHLHGSIFTKKKLKLDR